ncbi:MAG: YncE family protein, partial [Candidatus Eremiobacterota bacterium]
ANDGTSLYISNPGNHQVTKISLATKSISASIATGEVPTGLALSENGHFLYIANFKSNNINVIDTTNNTNVANIENVGKNPKRLFMIREQNLLYCVNWGSDDITVINTANNSIVKRVKTDAKPNDIVYLPAKNKAYVSCNKGQSVNIIDTAIGEVKSQIKINDFPTCLELSPDNKTLLLGVTDSNKFNNKIIIIDSDKNEIKGSIPVEKNIPSLLML